jgi:CubicO group peptidase (beta-lactamase class C family)
MQSTPPTFRLFVIGISLAGLSACGPQSSIRHEASAHQAAKLQSEDTPAALSTERLARLDGVLQQYVDEQRIAGAVALVLKDGEVVYERAVGWRDKETGREMTPDTIFRIASQTKALTSVAILMLMEEGKLALSTPVSRYIPEFAQSQVAIDKGGSAELVPRKRQITIRDLLTHTSGYSYGMEAFIASSYEAKGLGPAAGPYGWYTADKNEPVCATIARVATLPAAAQPGEAYVYGYSTDILGCVVERASGIALDEFLRARIIEPLGMKDTQFFLSASQKERLATVYASDADGKAVRAPEGPKGQGNYVDGPKRSFSGGAGLLSTAHDYARFLEMIRNGGELDGRRILSPRTVALMTTNQVGTLHSSEGLGFGLGFEAVERYGANGMDAPGAYGWGGAYGSTYRIDPASGLTLVFMMQLMPNETDIREKFPTLVYQALE